MNEHQITKDHEKFRELSALANTGDLTPDEWTELKEHLRKCQACREVHTQFLMIASEGMPSLAARYSTETKLAREANGRTLDKIRARIRAHGKQRHSAVPANREAAVVPALLSGISANRFLLAGSALAACLAVAITLGYHAVSAKLASAGLARASAEDRFQKLAAEKNNFLDERLGAQAKDLFRLQQESLRKESELSKLRSEIHELEYHATQLELARNAADKQSETVVAQREALTLRLNEAERMNQQVAADLVNLRSEHEKTLRLSTSFESKVNQLAAVNKEQESKLKSDEQFLNSDRDIRELMGARRLYIADVYDVDSRSLTRKPFGRVFYTEGKSLIVYAFDLDHQQELKNADTFQAWGQRQDRGKPLNLGIFYMDSESNRRWVLRVDDSSQLAGIDTMFVTVEPHGGSAKPTGKPFLYASLRKEANHP